MRDFFYCKIYSLVLLIVNCLVVPIGAQSIGQTGEGMNSMDLSEGSRIVFVGNSLIEEAQQYGILEFMMLNAWPGKKLNFRNLGWSGDTVDGSARSYISSPPKPYDLLIQQIESTKPDAVVLGYGNIEAYDGKDGLESFANNLNRLLDTIETMDAPTVLLSPIPQIEMAGMSTDLEDRNNKLILYAKRIEEIADNRKLPFADVFEELKQLGRKAYKQNGIHLNETGYYYLARTLLMSLGQMNQEWMIQVNSKSKRINSSNNLKVYDQVIDRDKIEFMVRDIALPLPVSIAKDDARIIAISGLKRGVYTLSIDQENIVSASAREWSDGVEITQGSSFDRARQIRKKLIQINELYFQEYRPLNRTYLVGMRLHEQKQNAYELKVNSLFINRLEEQIDQLLNQESQHYQLKRN